MKCKPAAEELVSSMVNGTSVILRASISDQSDIQCHTENNYIYSRPLMFMDLIFSISIICGIFKHS